MEDAPLYHFCADLPRVSVCRICDSNVSIDGPPKIRRLEDYIGPESVGPGSRVLGVVVANAPGVIDKTFVGALPTCLHEDQVMKPVKSFRELKAFNLVREGGNEPSKVWLFVEEH